MGEPAKDYQYNRIGNNDQQYNNQNQYMVPPENQNFNYNYNNNNNNNMGYPPQPQMGQPMGQPPMQQNPSMEQNMMYPPVQNNYIQPQTQTNQIGINQVQQSNSYGGSSGSNQFYSANANQPIYQPPTYAQGVPIEAQIIRVQGNGGGMNGQVPMLTNLDNCEYPTAFRCNFCQKESVSTIQIEPGTGTWMACCCLFFCTFGVLSFIPFCTDSCQDKKHFCPFCGAQVGFREYKPCG